MTAPLRPASVRGLAVRALLWLERGLGRIRSALDPTPETPVFRAGLPGEWEDFERRNRAFLTHFPALKAAINAALTQGFTHREDADVVIFFLGRLCAEDFLEIILMCANGYGFGATKLLRGMYERVVTARYLRLHPTEAEAFLSYGAVSYGKNAREILDVFGKELPPETVKKLKESIEEGKKERPRFMVPVCKKCGTERLNHTWTMLDLVSMARAVDGQTGLWIYPCYLEPLRHAHATAGALDARVKQQGGDLTFHPGPSRKEADTALMFAHMLMLNICDLVLAHFKPAMLEETLNKANAEYQRVWDKSGTAGAEGRPAPQARGRSKRARPARTPGGLD